MIKIKLSSDSKDSKPQEVRAIKNLQQILAREEGYLISIMFIGKQLINGEIDAVLLLPDSIFFIDFKDWYARRIEVEGVNEETRLFVHGSWEEENTLPDYERAARVMADRLKKQARQWLPTASRIYSILVFTRRPNTVPAQISFAGRDANASGWNEARQRYLNLQAGHTVHVVIDGQFLLVKSDVAETQMLTEAAKLEAKLRASNPPIMSTNTAPQTGETLPFEGNGHKNVVQEGAMRLLSQQPPITVTNLEEKKIASFLWLCPDQRTYDGLRHR